MKWYKDDFTMNGRVRLTLLINIEQKNYLKNLSYLTLHTIGISISNN